MRTSSFIRLPLLAATTVAAMLCFGSAIALADTTIDTTGCSADGFAELTALSPAVTAEAGNEFIAPATPGSLLTTFTAVVAADGSQAVTLELYDANASGPIGSPIWTAPATIASTGSVTTFAPETFTVDAPVTAGGTYAFALDAGPVTADVDWETVSHSSGSACDPGPELSGYANAPFFPPLGYATMAFAADFGVVQPPSASPSPISLRVRPPARSGMSRR